MCVGVTVWFGWGGVVSLCRLNQCFSLHVRADRGRRDGLKDTTKLTVAFRNFAKASKNGFLCTSQTYCSEIQTARLYTGVAITRLQPANLMNLISEF